MSSYGDYVDKRNTQQQHDTIQSLLLLNAKYRTGGDAK